MFGELLVVGRGVESERRWEIHAHFITVWLSGAALTIMLIRTVLMDLNTLKLV